MSAYFLVEVSIKVSIVLLGTWLATKATATWTSAAVRHLAWTATVVAVLCLPLLVFFGPSWRVAQVPARWMSGLSATVTMGGVRGRADSDVWPRLSPSPTHAPVDPSIPPASDGAPSSRTPAAAAAFWPPDWSALLVWIWGAGAVAGIGSVIVGLLRASWLARRAMPVVAPDWIAAQAAAAASLAVTRVVRLRISERITLPVACGVLRPTLLLPLEAGAWDPERRRVVLLHELAHVRRRDCLIQAVAHLTWAAHWFNPLLLVALSRLRAEQENACDDLVLGVGTAATDYANHLCEIASVGQRVSVPAWATLAIAHRSRLEVRVKTILDDALRRGATSVASRAAISAAVCLAAVSLSVIRASTAAGAIELLPSAAIQTLASYSQLMPAPQPNLRIILPTTDIAAADAVVVPTPAARPQDLSPSEARTFLASCIECHNSTRRVANVALDTLDMATIGDNRELWERVVRKLRGGLHFRSGANSPNRAAGDAFAAAVEASLDRLPPDTGSTGSEPMNQRDIAARLATFLWHAEPDATLLALADRNALLDPSTLQQQVRRMLADGRSSAFLGSFFGEWLFLKNVPTIRPDPALFPFDDQLRQSFQRETDLFLANQVRDDHQAMELLTANYTFLNERLARHYGIAKVTGSQFRRVAWPDDTRAGVLGQGSILSVTSYANRTSPVLRGKYLMEGFLGVQAPPPPPNVPALRNDDPAAPMSIRTRMEEHRKNPVCASCHVDMDPLGFALENFDAIGRWRDSDEAGTIDPNVTLADGSVLDGPAQVRRVLTDRREAVLRTITLKLLAHALGRPARFSDMPAVRAILFEAAPVNYKWSALILGVVRSTPFQTRPLGSVGN